MAAVIALVLPLSASSQRIASDTLRDSQVTGVANAWAEARDWEVVAVDDTPDGVEVRAIGPLPLPDPGGLRRALDRDGLEDLDVRLELVPTQGPTCPVADRAGRVHLSGGCGSGRWSSRRRP